MTRSLLALGLVDRLELLVVPTLAQRGRRLFDDGGPAPQRLQLLSSERTATGNLLLSYDVTHDVTPEGAPT